MSEALFLAGFMGTGKSVVGRRLARLLERPFVDTDKVVAKALGGRSPRAVIQERGMEAFRDQEKRVITQIRGNEVVAMGGGSDLNGETRDFLKGKSVARLRAPLSVIEARLGKGEGRPLWKERKKLYLEREGEGALGIPVQTEGLTQGAVAGRVLRQLYPDKASQKIGDGVLMGWGQMSRPLPTTTGKWVGLFDQRLGALVSEAPEGGVSHLPLVGKDRAKNLRTVERILEGLSVSGVGKDGALWVLGGGGITDVAGLAAALYLRGIAIHLVPTTVLGMADAALGGKFGVNRGKGKNLLGVVRLPDSVVIDPTLLAGLPLREIRNGAAEIIKMSWVWRQAALAMGEEEWEGMGKGRLIPIERGIQWAAKGKLKIVKRDLLEKRGLRILLNFGHTVGHALESSTVPRIRHGEGVGLGMLTNTRWAERLGVAPKGTAAFLEKELVRVGLPTSLDRELNPEAFKEAILKDKKWDKGELQVLLPTQIPNGDGGEWDTIMVYRTKRPPIDEWLAQIA
ncbi:bifunctional shikimate kinase/3-dehydroquinate synthase [bacterium]|nr:bifunctional shikimate kinase/3-dehydroquinate synthase [bacterium]